MAWLLRDGEVLAGLEVAPSGRSPWRSLTGRDGIDGALLVCGAPTVHTFGGGAGIDVAFCVADRPLAPGPGAGETDMITVVDITSLAPYRIARPRRRARCVVAARVGAFERWRLRVGDRLEVR